jgi:nitric oxide reductase subunit B
VAGEKFVGVSFGGLNGGLVLMVVTNLFPGGVFQRLDVLQHGYWHARRPEFVAQGLMHTIEWLRLPADPVCIGLAVVPMVLANGLTCRAMSANPPRPVGSRGG